jgi:hypothetical protein
MVVLVSAVTAAAVAAKTAEVWPAFTCTVAGTVTAEVLEEIATVAPLSAGAESVTVQLAVAELLTDDGAQVNPRVCGAALMLMVLPCACPFTDAVITEFWLAVTEPDVNGKVALMSPLPMVTLGGTVSGAWALRAIVAAAVAAVLREAVQVPDPLLEIDAGRQLREINSGVAGGTRFKVNANV